MLDGILGRGFGSKCKSLIKPTRTRIDVVRRRKEATQRFLKGNLAQLLANGFDIDAYGRTEEFLAGLDILSCYDYIEQSCVYILKQLSVMQKHSECPEECREAVGSLMFAAARFSDLPELRDLRDTFQERYGGSLEHFVSQKFVEQLSLRPPTMEKKIKLLQDIASEFLIKWDSRGFEQRMANPSASVQDKLEKYEPIHDHDHDNKYKLPNGKEAVTKTDRQNHSTRERSELASEKHRVHNGEDKLEKYEPIHDHDNKYKLPNGKEAVTKTDRQNHSTRERSELASEKHRVHNGGEGNLLKRNDLDRQFFVREELTGNNHKSFVGSEQSTPKRENYEIPFRARRDLTDGRDELSSVNGKDSALKRVIPASSSCGKRSELVNNGYEVHKNSVNSSYNDYSQSKTANSTRKVREEERDRLKPYSGNALPPPYIKSRDKLVPPPYIKSIDSKYGVNAEPKHPSSDYDGSSTNNSTHKRDDAEHRSERIRGQSDHRNYDDRVVGPSHVSSHGHEKDSPHQDDIHLPKPRSIRSKRSKSSSSHDDLGNFEEAGSVVKRSSSSRRRDTSRRGLQILFDDEHHQKDEEERMMDKLLLHYSKKPSSCDPEKVRRKSKAPDAHYSRDGRGVQAEMVPAPTRSASLPREQIAPTEAVKVYARANSFHPDEPARHVHPKLPDYDDLAAQFAALRGR